MNAQDFINSVATGNAAEAKDTLNNLLSARAFEALETKKIEIAQTLFGGYQVEEEVEDLNESDIENGYKIRMKHIDKGRIHSPSGEHVATVTREHGEGWRYHSGNKNWDGLETSKHYKTGVEKTKAAAAKKAVQAHMNEQVEQIDELSKNTLRSYLKGSKAEAESQLRGDVSDKAASLGRTQQDKDDGRYEGGKLAKRKLGAPGSIPPKVMAK